MKTAQGKSKGQAFIAGAALLIVVLALLRTSATAIPVQTGFLSITAKLDNIEREFGYVAGLSRLSGTDNVYTFSQYMRGNVDGMSSFYLLIDIGSGSFNITAGNFLTSIVDVNISVPTATPSYAVFTLQDTGVSHADFSAMGAVNLSLHYANRERNLTFQVSPKTILVYEIGITDSGSTIRRIGTWSG